MTPKIPEWLPILITMDCLQSGKKNSIWGLKSIGKPTTLHSIYDYPLVVLSLRIAISASTLHSRFSNGV